jgi:hypothetical protein
MLFIAKVNVMIAEWSMVLTAHVVVYICQKFEKHWFRKSSLLKNLTTVTIDSAILTKRL